jgi:hypothetical protein
MHGITAPRHLPAQTGPGHRSGSVAGEGYVFQPANADAWLEYGRLLFDLGAYQRLTGASPTIKLRPQLAIAYNLMSQTQRKLGKSDEAARYLARSSKSSVLSPSPSAQI